jgi:uncharacterized protein
MEKQPLKITVGVVTAASVWFVIFVLKPVNFWLSMCCGIILLIITARLLQRELFKFGQLRLRHILVGSLSAAALYMVFYIGDYLSGFIIPMKDAQIADVYLTGQGTSPVIISAALLFVIGPGESIFWHGFIQKSLLGKSHVKSVVITAVLYAAVHIVTLNFMLIMAAFVCGLFWGLLFDRLKSVYPVIISHALWDITVFVLLPLHR